MNRAYISGTLPNVVAAMQQSFGGKLPLAMVIGKYNLETWESLLEGEGETKNAYVFGSEAACKNVRAMGQGK